MAGSLKQRHFGFNRDLRFKNEQVREQIKRGAYNLISRSTYIGKSDWFGSKTTESKTQTS